jgi:uncharacterized protein YbjT (DUF2867 family)
LAINSSRRGLVLPFDIAGGNHTRSMASLRILVTGATGFLGTHVTAAVKAAGHRALSTGRRGGDVAVAGGEGVQGALFEPHRLRLAAMAACATAAVRREADSMSVLPRLVYARS